MKNIQSITYHNGIQQRYVKCASHAYGDTCDIETDFRAYDAPVLCDLCSEDAPVVAFDTSGGEYASVRICGDCFGTLLAEYQGPEKGR